MNVFLNVVIKVASICGEAMELSNHYYARQKHMRCVDDFEDL